MTGGMRQVSGVTYHLSWNGVVCQMFAVMCHKSIVRKGPDRATYCLLVSYHLSLERCHVSYVNCQVSNVRCNMSGVICQISHVRKANSKSQHRPLVMFHFRCQMSGVRCQMPGVKYHKSQYRCQVSPVRCHVNCVTSEMSELSEKAPSRATIAHWSGVVCNL